MNKSPIGMKNPPMGGNRAHCPGGFLPSTNHILAPAAFTGDFYSAIEDRLFP
jgi:hypothetical protein